MTRVWSIVIIRTNSPMRNDQKCKLHSIAERNQLLAINTPQIVCELTIDEWNNPFVPYNHKVPNYPFCMVNWKLTAHTVAKNQAASTLTRSAQREFHMRLGKSAALSLYHCYTFSTFRTRQCLIFGGCSSSREQQRNILKIV